MVHFRQYLLLTDFPIISENVLKTSEDTFLDNYAILRCPGNSRFGT